MKEIPNSQSTDKFSLPRKGKAFVQNPESNDDIPNGFLTCVKTKQNILNISSLQ